MAGSQAPSPVATNLLRLARLASDVYKDRSDPARTPGSCEVAPPARLGRGVFEDATCGFFARLYQPEEAGAPMVLAMRGTRFKNLRNWETNILQATGHVPKAYGHARRLGQLAAQEWGSEGVIVCGHSLGGGLATYAAAMSGLRCAGFNSAGLSPVAWEKIERHAALRGWALGEVHARCEQISIGGDLLSHLGFPTLRERIQLERIPRWPRQFGPRTLIEAPGARPFGVALGVVDNLATQAIHGGNPQKVAMGLVTRGAVHLWSGVQRHSIDTVIEAVASQAATRLMAEDVAPAEDDNAISP